MTRLSDEQLMAYADGQPPFDAAETREATRAALSADEQSVVEEFRRTGDLVRHAFAEDDKEPISPDLLALVTGPAQAPSNVVPLRRKTERRPLVRFDLPMVACLAAALVASVALLDLSTTEPQRAAQRLELGPVGAETALAGLLERSPSGVPVDVTGPSVDEKTHVMAIGTFRDRNSRICREFEMLDSSLVPEIAAVACRSPSGNSWTVEGTAIVAARGTGDDGTSFAPAGSPESEALAGLLKMLGATATLPPEVERSLIESGWK